MAAKTPTEFRADFPEFSNTTTYPDGVIQFWLNVAYKQLNSNRWGDLLDVAAELYTAHNIVLEAKAIREAGVAGGLVTGSPGMVTSKGVDKVSVGYDVNTATEEGAGFWNSTVYGTRFYRLMMLHGAGPLQVGIGVAPPLSGPAWPGPPTGLGLWG